MASSRTVADRLTDTLQRGDLHAMSDCYAANAVVVTPEGMFIGREQITGYFRTWLAAFSDVSVDVVTKADWDDVALDEWSISCTNTGDIELPTGETVAATGRRVTLRGIDLCTVEADRVTEHHIYYDQLELLGQLELLPS